MATQYISHNGQWTAIAVPTRLASRCRAIVKEIRARSEMSKAFCEVSDRLLQDAGLIRNDIDAACALDLTHAAAADLDAARRRRSGNW